MCCAGRSLPRSSLFPRARNRTESILALQAKELAPRGEEKDANEGGLSQEATRRPAVVAGAGGACSRRLHWMGLGRGCCQCDAGKAPKERMPADFG